MVRVSLELGENTTPRSLRDPRGSGSSAMRRLAHRFRIVQSIRILYVLALSVAPRYFWWIVELAFHGRSRERNKTVFLLASRLDIPCHGMTDQILSMARCVERTDVIPHCPRARVSSLPASASFHLCRGCSARRLTSLTS